MRDERQGSRRKKVQDTPQILFFPFTVRTVSSNNMPRCVSEPCSTTRRHSPIAFVTSGLRMPDRFSRCRRTLESSFLTRKTAAQWLCMPSRHIRYAAAAITTITVRVPTLLMKDHQNVFPGPYRSLPTFKYKEKQQSIIQCVWKATYFEIYLHCI